jgi:tetratricopeptide (TPR) repeat protein
MVRTLFVITLFAVLVLPLAAQKSKVTSGSMAYQSGEYEKALKLLDEALSKPDLLDAKDKAKAWFKKGQAYRGIIGTGNTEMLTKYPNAAFDAIDAFEKSADFDQYKTFEKERESEMLMMGNIMYQGGFAIYQQGAKMMATNAETAKPIIVEAVRYLKKADEMQPGNASILAILGSALMTSGQHDEAKVTLEKAISIYESRKDKSKVEKSMVLTYRDLAELHFYQFKNAEQAMSIVEQAMKEFPETKEFETLELNYYLQGDNIEKGIQKFEAAIQANPESEVIHAAYASLLEKKGDIEGAAKIYQKILGFSPKSFIANYQIAAMYFNSAVEFAAQANATDDINLATELTQKKDEYFQRALPFMEAAYEIDNTDLPTVSALGQIYMQVNNMDKANEFIELKKKMQAK